LLTRKRRKPDPPGDGQHKGHHHQAHNVVYEERREHAAGKHHGGQQVRGLQAAQNKLHAPFEEPHQVKIAHNQHHRKQQDDGGKVNEMQCFAGRDDPEGHHGDRADNRRARTVNLEPRELPQRKYKVAGNKNNVGGDQSRVRQRDRAKFVHTA
jgi:hypothetical protein